MKIWLLISTMYLAFFGFHAEAEEASSSYSNFKATVGPFYDGNVGQSLAFSNSSFNGEEEGGGPGGQGGPGGHGGPPPPPPINLPTGRPTATVLIDWGAIATLNYDPTLFKSGKNDFGLTAELDTSSYQTYQSYNYESLKFGPTWQNSSDWQDFSSSLYYQATFYQGISSQDYLKSENSYSYKGFGQTLSTGLNFTQYLKNHANAFNANIPLSTAVKFGSFTTSLSYTFGYGGGNPALYYQQNLGAVPTVVGGDEFSRYTQNTLSLGLDEKWSDRFSSSLNLSQTQTYYLQESVPFTNAPGVAYGSRADALFTANLDIKYQIKPDKWSCDLAATFTRSWSSGYQGLPSGSSGPPSYSFDRPYAALTLIYEM